MLKGASKSKKLAMVAIFVALIVIGTYIKIPFPGTPKTLQIVFTTIAGLMLGSAYGGLSIGIWILMGLIGLPVFTEGGGFMYVVKPTFGYIIGFLIGAIVEGSIVQHSKSKSYWVYMFASLVNMAIVYACGLIYFYFISTFYLGESVTAHYLFYTLFLAIALPDFFFCILAAALSKKLSHIMRKSVGAMTDQDMIADLDKISAKVAKHKDINIKEWLALEGIDLEILCDYAGNVKLKHNTANGEGANVSAQSIDCESVESFEDRINKCVDIAKSAGGDCGLAVRFAEKKLDSDEYCDLVKVLAIYRLMLPSAKISLYGDMSNLPDRGEFALSSGVDELVDDRESVFAEDTDFASAVVK